MLSKSSPEIKLLIEEMEGQRGVDNAKMLDLAVSLYDKAQQDGNQDLKAFASCALGDACCQNYDFSNAVPYLSEGIPNLVRNDDFLMGCRCFNELGIVLRSQGHYMAAEDAFTNAIQLACVNRLYRYEAMASANFSALCIEMEDYEDALKYYQRAIECFYRMEEDEGRYRYIVGVLSFMVRIYIEMDNEFKATTTIREMENNIIEHDNVMEGTFEITDIRMLYYDYIGDKAKAELYEKQALDLYYKCENYTIYFDESIILFNFLLKNKNYVTLKAALEHFESIAVGEDMVNQSISIQELYMKIYEALGEKEKLMEAALRYVGLLSKKNVEAKKSFADAVHLKESQPQSYIKDVFRSAEMSIDALTGIASRDKASVLTQKLHDTAFKEGKSLGILAMDIDQFKEINESFGSDVGDKILEKIGNILKQFESDNILPTRYNGDFFLISFYDATDATIIEVMKKIAVSIPEISREFALGRLTVSQAAINHVPTENNRPWDYLACADDALYKVKSLGGNNAILINYRKDLKEAKPIF